MRNRRVFAGVVGVILLCLLLLPAGLRAQSISEGYDAANDVQVGMIVGIDKANTKRVITINSDDARYAHGVVVNGNDAPATISNGDQRVFVATSGRFDMLVSDENGKIAIGDYLTVSSVKGVGMKAGETQPIAVGRAIEAFDSKNSAEVVSTIQAKAKDGGSLTIKLGRIAVELDVKPNPLEKKVADVPDFLKRVGESIAGKPVSASRIYVSLLILIIASSISGSLIYSAVRNSMIAIGRNPLSKHSIIRSLFQVTLIGFTIFASGMLGVYLLLRI